MKISLLFACGVMLTALVAFTLVRYVNKPLKRQLTELCGNVERAEFWAAFSNATIVLTPIVFAMLVDFSSEAIGAPLFAIINLLKWGLIGLVTSVLMLGWILSRFLSRSSVPSHSLASEQKLETGR